MILFFQLTRPHDKIPRTFDFDSVVPYNVCRLSIKALLSYRSKSYQGSQKVATSRKDPRDSRQRICTERPLCTHVHMYTTCVSISRHEHRYIHWPGRIDAARCIARNGPTNPAVAGKFPPPSPSWGIFRFHVSMLELENYSTTRICVFFLFFFY